ncbi:hypothetical protein AWN90_11165 [Nocardia terpenica]|uniref:DUF6879 domain-containing protein n=1 Tax=Nocardia terpenica TaxID=455432 RepID=A0A164HDX1_9NOCA|nr:hypothetical protein AWN90_11165 [Nocardia terpenica]
MGFDDLVTAFRSYRRAFHLEVRDDYTGVPGEAEALQRFLAGMPLDPAFTAQWYALMRDVTSAGTTVQRVRIVTEPHTDYIRFAASTVPGSLVAGEDIRWLPRNDAPAGLPDDDWWLFDEDLVAWTVFEQDGTALPGWVASTDPALTGHYAGLRDQLWDKAIRHGDYMK